MFLHQNWNQIQTLSINKFTRIQKSKAGLMLMPESFLKKDTLPQVFSCELCNISKNTFSDRTPPVAASVLKNNLSQEHYQQARAVREIGTSGK